MATFTLEQGTNEFKQYLAEQKIDVPLEYVNPMPPDEKSAVSYGCAWSEDAPPNAQQWHQNMHSACDSMILTLHSHAASILESGRTCYWNVRSVHDNGRWMWHMRVVRYNPEHPVKQAREALEADAPRVDEPADAAAQHAGAA